VLSGIPILPSLTELAAAKNMTYTLCGWPTSDDTHVFPVTNIVGIVVAIISVALRLTSRAMDKRLGWDDLLIFIALVIDCDGNIGQVLTQLQLFAASISGIGLKRMYRDIYG
jgi:hypothetical protein